MLTQDMPLLAEYKISDNLRETREGYLICYGVKVARIGVQEYLGRELGINDRYDELIKVHRFPEEVFDKKALMSLEGKPITDDHPDVGVNIGNYSIYAKGHIRNVRQEGDFVVADLVVTDPVLIDKIKSGKRGVSCGYDCKWEPHGTEFKQTGIRMNHVAVVVEGRAGPKVVIKDHLSVSKKTVNKGVSKIMNLKDAVVAMLPAYAKDATSEDVAKIAALLTTDENTAKSSSSEMGLMAQMMGIFARDKQAKDEEAKAEKEEEKEKEAKDSTAKALDALNSKFDKLLNALVGDKAKDEDEEEDLELIEKLKENEEKEAAEDESAEAMGALDEEAEEEKEKEAKDAAYAQLMKDLKPVLATLKPADQKKVKNALARSKKGASSGTYAAIKKIATQGARDSAMKEDPSLIGKKIAEARNPHYKNQAKSIF